MWVSNVLFHVPLIILGLTGTADCSEFPQFRGAGGQGHAQARNLPLHWNSVENVAWKTPVPGSGWSSPVISGGRIWLTSCDEKRGSLHVISLNCETGQVEKNVAVFEKSELGRVHPKNSHASPTLIVSQGRLFAHFGAHGTACVSTSGEVLWTRELAYYHHHGPAASPVLSGQRLIISCDGFTRPFYDRLIRPGVTSHQFVVGLDADTGKIQWQSPRQGRHSYATPLEIDVDGQRQVICPGGDGVYSYDPLTGAEIWRVRYTGYSVVPRPVYGHGLVYVCTGYDKAWLAAIRPDGRGDVTETHVQWSTGEGVPFNPSPLLVEDKLYVVSDLGIVQCLDALTGKRIWRGRLGGAISASPVYADGKIYFQSETGVTHIVEPGRRFKRLAVNRVRGRTLASPAIVERSIYLRTDRMMYCLQELDRNVD